MPLNPCAHWTADTKRELTSNTRSSATTAPPSNTTGIAFAISPTEDGTCAVQATRDKTFDTYDYFVYYLVGDCAGQSVEVSFRKGGRFWRDHTQEYEGDLTDKISDKRGRKTFVLADGADKDRIGFAVRKGGRANKFKPVAPAEVAVVVVS